MRLVIEINDNGKQLQAKDFALLVVKAIAHIPDTLESFRVFIQMGKFKEVIQPVRNTEGETVGSVCFKE